MRTSLHCITALLALLLAAPTIAATPQEKRLVDATDVVDQLLRIPEQTVPPALLARAYAVAVIPNVVKVGFLLGARRGKGILVVRQPDNSWSNPAFITLTGGSIGWQAGAQSTDVILVFKTRKGVEDIENGKLTLGADASIAAGPVGRSTSAATDLEFQAEVYSYSRSRGLFAGVALDGSGISMDHGSNAAFYGSPSITPAQIFSGSGNAAPAAANSFVQLLTAQTRRLPKQAGMEAGVATTDGPPEPKPKVRTFAIGDPDAPRNDDSEVAKQY